MSLMSLSVWQKKDAHARSFFVKIVKGTLMQILKSPYKFVFIWKRYPESFAFLIPRTLELFTREVCKFLKK